MPENVNLRRIFLITLIGSVVTSAVVGIGVILFGDFGSFEVRILMTTLTVTAMSILGMACGAYLESGRGRLLPFLGIGLSIVSALMIFLIIWDLLDDSELFIKSTISASLLATSCSHLSLISLARLDKRFIWSRITAFVCVWTLAAILLYILWFEPDSTSDLVLRIIGILSILIAAITIMTPVFHKLSVGNAGTAAIDAEIEKLKARIEELEAEKARLATNGQPAEIS